MKWNLANIRFGVYTLLIFGFAAKGLFFNTIDLLHLRLPRYYINSSLLSGALLLYDRSMFFETRRLEVKEVGNSQITILDYDLSDSGYESYLKRRLFRFATNENNCGGDREAAFQILFCKSTLEIVKKRKIDEVTIRFQPHLISGSERVFKYQCRQNE